MRTSHKITREETTSTVQLKRRNIKTLETKLRGCGVQWTDSGTSAGFYAKGNELSGAMKGKDFYTCISNIEQHTSKKKRPKTKTIKDGKRTSTAYSS
jgi:hypothetical protein